jgi:hypothetical protein
MISGSVKSAIVGRGHKLDILASCYYRSTVVLRFANADKLSRGCSFIHELVEYADAI